MPKIISVGNIGGGQTQSRTVYMPQGLSPTLCSSMGDKGNTMPYIVEVKKMDVKLIGNMDHTLDNTFESANRVYSAEGLCPTIPTGTGGGHMPKILEVNKLPKVKIRQATAQGFIYEIDGAYYRIRIRKLTPRECWRLMGFTDEDFEKAESVNSNTQLYKEAGNSIVKNVLMAIFGQMI